MFFGPFILLRILLISCLVFILGYVFGNFSRKPLLTKITKIAAVLLTVSFIAGGFLFFRWNSGWRYGNFNKNDRMHHHCVQKDSVVVR